MKILYLILLSLVLVACGGGSSPEQRTSIRLDGNSVLYGSYVGITTPDLRSENAPGKVVAKSFTNSDVYDFSYNGATIESITQSANWPMKICTDWHIILEYHNSNPVDFEERLTKFVKDSCASKKILVMANLPTEPYYPKVAINAVTLRKVAEKTQTKLCDAQVALVGYNADDFIHPNDTGYKILSEKIVECIRNY